LRFSHLSTHQNPHSFISPPKNSCNHQAIHQVAEGTGASPLAATLNWKETVRGKKIALILNGGNITLETLKECI
jgi:threonine dehydratase